TGYSPGRNEWAAVTVGPDLDGDGRREVFLASRFATPHESNGQLFVEALSGRAGRPLWRWSSSVWGVRTLRPLSWWDPPGADGWPQLLVSLVSKERDNTQPTFVLSAGTGRLAQQFGDLPDPRQADFDGDGIPDLLVSGADGTVSAVRGTMPEAWRRLGRWEP